MVSEVLKKLSFMVVFLLLLFFYGLKAQKSTISVADSLTKNQMASIKNTTSSILQYSGKNLSSKHQSIRKSSAEGEALVVNAFYFSATHV
jgi:hypothetical protein